MCRHLFLALVGLLAALASLRVTARDGRVDFYNRWDTVPTKTLVEKGAEFLKTPDKYDSATVCFTVVVNRYNKKQLSKDELPLCVKALSSLGYLYQYQYFDYSKSYAYLQQALALSEDNGYTASMPRIYLNMGTLYYANYMWQGDKAKAYSTMGYFKKAFHAARHEKMYTTVLNSFTNLLDLVFFYGDPKDISEEIAQFKRLQFPKDVKNVEFTRQLCDMVEANGKNDTQKAIDIMDNITRYIEDEDSVRYLLIVYTNKSNLLEKVGRRREAMECVRRKLHMAQDYGVKDILVDAYKDMATLHKAFGNETEAARYELLYLRQKDSLMTQSRLNKVSEYSFLYQLKRINDQVEEMTQRHERQQTLLAAAIVVAVAIALCLVVVICNYRRLKETNKRLYEKNKQLLEKEDEERKARDEEKTHDADGDKSKYRSSSIDDDDKERILLRIKKVMDSSDEIFQEDFSLNRLAELIHTHQRYVSQVLNEQDGKNFKTMLNEYRIKESCRRMSDGDTYANYSIESIAESVGFKSRTYFSSLFKRMTGLTPSEYQRQALLDKKQHKTG